MKKGTVNFLNKLNESVKPVKKECDKPNIKENKKSLKEGEDGWYEVTIGFAGLIGAENDYSIQADSKEDAVNDALEEAQMDLEVIAVDGEEYIYESEKPAKIKITKNNMKEIPVPKENIKATPSIEREMKNKKKLKEESYNDDIYRRIEEALQNAGFTVDRYTDAGVLTYNLGWVVYDSSGEVNLTCDGTWLDDEEDEEDEEYNESALNEKINKDNIEINKAIANPNLGKNKDKIKAAGYDVDDMGYAISNPKTGKFIRPSYYDKEERKKIDFKGKLDSKRDTSHLGLNKNTVEKDRIPKSARLSGDSYNYDEIGPYYSSHGPYVNPKPKKSISSNVNDYKKYKSERDLDTINAEKAKKYLPHYEDEVKQAKKELKNQKDKIKGYENNAKKAEQKRKDVLTKVRAKKNESEEMLKESLVPVSELPDFCYGVLPSDCSIIIIKKGENGYYLTNKGYEREYEDIEDWNEKNNKADEICNKLNAQINVTPEQRQSMEVRSMFGNWND